jgi:outer membrane protein
MRFTKYLGLWALMLAAPLWGASASPAVSSGGVTLEECYARARQMSETVQIQEEQIRIIETQFRRALAGILPDIGWTRTYFIQEKQEVNESSTSVSGTLLRNTRPESYFYLQQPLFNGFREYNAMKGAKALQTQNELLRDQALLELLGDVTDAFYSAFDLQEEVKVLQLSRKVTQERIDELQRRVRLGKSRDSETLSAQVQLLSIDAQIEDAQRTHATLRETLRFLTGVAPDVALSDTRPAPVTPAADTVLARVPQRPDVQAAERNRDRTDYALRYARGGYSPTLDVLGRYYTERVGFQEDVSWDVTFTLNVPIFQGFSTRAAVSQAKSEQTIADLEASRIRRQAEQQVRTAVQSLGFALSRAEAYRKAVELGTKNMQIQEREYRLGLINNLELLQVQNELQSLRQNWVRAQATAKIQDVSLRIATGQAL